MSEKKASMKYRRKIVQLALIFTLLVGCGGKTESVIVKTSAETMQAVSTWQGEIIILTPADNPVGNLNELSVSGGEVGMWGPNPNEVKKFLGTFGQSLPGLQMIGDVGEGTRLFCDNPNLRLFITQPDYEKYILDTGCGVRVLLEEE